MLIKNIFKKSTLASLMLVSIMSLAVMGCDNTPDIKVSDAELFSADWWKTATVSDVKSLVKQKIDLRKKLNDSVSILDIAFSHITDPKIVKVLVQSGVDLNEKNYKGGSFLLAAIVNNQSPEIIQSMLDSGADINAKTDDGAGALAFALMKPNPNLDTVKLLIKNGADVNVKDYSFGATPLMVAASNNTNGEAISILFKNGADINATNNKGANAAMMAAIQNPNVEVIQILIDNGADIQVIAKEGGMNALSFGAMNKNPMVFKTIQQSYFNNLTEKEKTTVCIGYMGGIMGRNDQNVETRFINMSLLSFHRKYGEEGVNMDLLLSARPIGLNTNISQNVIDMMNNQCNPLLRDLNQYSSF